MFSSKVHRLSSETSADSSWTTQRHAVVKTNLTNRSAVSAKIEYYERDTRKVVIEFRFLW
jgi:hypothetical protein